MRPFSASAAGGLASWAYRAAASAAFCLTLLEGCSLLVPLGEDAPEGSDAEAGTDARDDAATNAPPDAGAADDGIDAAGGPDGASGLADASDGGCPAKFCDDFERTTVQGSWDSVGPMNGDSVAIVDDTAAGSAHGRVLELTGCSDPSVDCTPFLKKGFAASPTSVTYIFDLRTQVAAAAADNFSGLDLGQQGGATDPQAFLLLTGGQSCSIGYQVGGTSVGYTGSTVGTNVFPTGTWVEVELEYMLGSEGGLVQVLLDGAVTTTVTLPKDDFAPAPFAIVAGVFYSHDTVAFIYDIDNVRVDYVE